MEGTVNKLKLLFRKRKELKRSCVCCVSVLSDPDSGGVRMLFPKSSTFPPRPRAASTAPHHNRPPALQSIRNLLPCGLQDSIVPISSCHFQSETANYK